jgi:hypothetical protein
MPAAKPDMPAPMMIVSYIGELRRAWSGRGVYASFINGSKYLTVLAIDTSCP